MNSGCFHPDYSDAFITASDDRTIRVLDMTKKLYGVVSCLTHKDAIKCVDKTGHKVQLKKITVRGSLILAYCSDQTIQAHWTIGIVKDLNSENFLDYHKSGTII